MVADAIKAGLEFESDSDDDEPKPAHRTTSPYSTGKMDDNARHFRTELDPVFGQPIRLGPKMAGLTPLRTSFSRFTYVVHYAPYRLVWPEWFLFLVIGSVYRGVEVRKVMGTGGETQQKTVNILSVWS